MNIIMDKLRNNNIFNEKEKIDYLNRDDILKTNALKIIIDDNKYFMIRPSGTEPKLKLYLFTDDKDKNESINKMRELYDLIQEKLN